MHQNIIKTNSLCRDTATERQSGMRTAERQNGRTAERQSGMRTAGRQNGRAAERLNGRAAGRPAKILKCSLSIVPAINVM